MSTNQKRSLSGITRSTKQRIPDYSPIRQIVNANYGHNTNNMNNASNANRNDVKKELSSNKLKDLRNNNNNNNNNISSYTNKNLTNLAYLQNVKQIQQPINNKERDKERDKDKVMYKKVVKPNTNITNNKIKTKKIEVELDDNQQNFNLVKKVVSTNTKNNYNNNLNSIIGTYQQKINNMDREASYVSNSSNLSHVSNHYSKLKKFGDAILKEKNRNISDKLNNSYNLINSSTDIKLYSGNKSKGGDNSRNEKNEKNLLSSILENKENLM